MEKTTITVICDACGKTIAEKSTTQKIRKHTENLVTAEILDFCEDCAYAFLYFMRERKDARKTYLKAELLTIEEKDE